MFVAEFTEVVFLKVYYTKSFPIYPMFSNFHVAKDGITIYF